MTRARKELARVGAYVLLAGLLFLGLMLGVTAVAVASMLHLAGGAADLDVSLQPRGYRLLAKIPRLPDGVIDRIIDRFGNLQKIMRATIDDLDDVEGVGEARARAIKEGLSRLAETSILDRYS